jgi:DNA-binding CsgD family transcriptional regulator
VGDLGAADQLASGLSGSVEGEEPGYNAGIVAFALAGLREARGDRHGALDLLLRCWRYDAKHGNAYYHRRLAPPLVRLALAADDRAAATEVAELVVATAALAPEVPSVRGVALRCTALLGADVDPALEAVDLARRSTLLLEHAGACEDAASLLARCGRTEEATHLLAEALDRFDRAGADSWAGRVRARMRRLGARPGPRGARHRPATGWESLTATERAVSVLVAEGLTNGAVARRLYISPHTVNTHLRHVFAKLGVSNRVALAGVVHRANE